MVSVNEAEISRADVNVRSSGKEAGTGTNSQESVAGYEDVPLGIQMSPNENSRHEMSQTYDEICAEFLDYDGSKTRGQSRSRVQEREQNRAEMRIESAKASLERKHR